LEAVIGINNSIIEINPLLLNSDDYLLIKILYAGDEPKVSCHPRIAGISKVVELNRGVKLGPKEKLDFLSVTVLTIIFGLLFFIASLFYKKMSDEIHYVMYPLFGAWLFGLATFVIEWLRGHFSNNKHRYIDNI
jgi:hypothetical protein